MGEGQDMDGKKRMFIDQTNWINREGKYSNVERPEQLWNISNHNNPNTEVSTKSPVLPGGLPEQLA